MSLRRRLTLVGAGAVFVALATASLVIYFAVRSNLEDQVDASLIQGAQSVAAKWTVAHKPPSAFGQVKPVEREFGKTAEGFFQVIPSLRRVTRRQLAEFVPLAGPDGAVASGLSPPYFSDVRFAGAAARLYTMRLPSTSDGLVRVARPLTDANATLGGVRRLLILLTLGGALAAGLLGWLAASAVLRPVRALARTVREVSATRDLTRRIPIVRRDELASLAGDFNAMLTALEDSQRTQQQLIADASHELRTPLTAHRANIELLARPDLPAEQRQHVLGTAIRTIEELSSLVRDLIQAARDGRSLDARESLALEEIVAAAVERARHRAPDLRFESELEPATVSGARARLERAIDNVLENAIKWSAPGGTIEIRLADRTLSVRDHGPGIAETDLPHVFDRFYRAAAARSLPGSGLGLAIVKQTVEDHGGCARAENADDGGALLTLDFPEPAAAPVADPRPLSKL
ncbi:MAG TPA: HAMP domain-containing sensor histidine kinase [Solirubrobacteraceae bacterium]|nr:HAMP domain-containing sensor histidine kinase [Solirubrobacteraceae bacterium]